MVRMREGRLEDHSSSVNGLREDLRLGVDRLDARMDRLDEKVSRQFVWLVGIQVTLLMSILGALLAR